MDKKLFKIKVKFSKTQTMVYISHLDLMRLYQRALRRADLPIALTKGFSPHPRISITPALKLGQSSSGLEANIYLNEQIDETDFKNRLQIQLPSGIDILQIEEEK